jgi:hypothetical protein
MPRIGDRMVLCLKLLDSSGGEIEGVVNLARMVGPNGSTKYGYEIVTRCVRHGLVSISGEPSGSGRTAKITDEGRRVLSSQTD